MSDKNAELKVHTYLDRVKTEFLYTEDAQFAHTSAKQWAASAVAGNDHQAYRRIKGLVQAKGNRDGRSSGSC
eukprot:4042855-Amphidinium_carterae.1